jgi:hypothetical protein
MDLQGKTFERSFLQHQFRRKKKIYIIDSRSLSQNFVIAKPSVHPEAGLKDLNFENSLFELELAQQEEAKQQLQRDNEINSAIRSLTTNFYLSFVFLIFFIMSPYVNEMVVVVVWAFSKVIVPIIATVSNFLKIHTLMAEMFLSCKNKVSRLVKW